jgi:hypothetical protein
MTLYELLTLLTAVVAVVVSVLSLVRTRRVEAEQLRQGRAMVDLAERQLEKIEEEERAESRANLSAELVKDGRNSAIIIVNLSGNPARDVQFELIDCPKSPFVGGDYERKLPAPVLQPHGRIRLLAAITRGSPLTYRARLRWTDPDGTEREEEVFLSV